ncbi:MAG TPA: ABC transporter ATP-binding protein [Methylomirabilota bacterium]|nr:ABC transporter ATP-binding protein [Methylomirabilota bacterium]
MDVIETCDLTKHYGPHRAVASLDLAVRQGETYGFLGPNGSGKTTTIRMLTGVLRPSSGHARVAGHDVQSESGALRARVGLLPESTGVYPWMTPVEYLRFFADLYGMTRGDAEARIWALLRWVGLADRMATRIATFSRGMRARLAMARALVHRPQVVFLDEPTLGLDPVGQQDILALIQRANREEGMTVFLSSHALDQIGQVCTRVGILNEGRLIAQGTAPELSRRLGLRHTVRLTVSDAGRAQRVIETLERSSDASVRDAEHLVLTPTDGELPTDVVLRALVHANISVRELVVTTPTLGDVFLALVSRERTAA